MCQLVESIRIEAGKLHHINLHNKRFNEGRQALFGSTNTLNLQDVIQVPEHLESCRYKCRVTTNGSLISYSISQYEQRSINSLKVVEGNDIDYSYKTSERQKLNELYAQKGNCDDIIIIKNEKVTDSWAANILFFDGQEWVTSSTPLLKGIQREYLLSTGVIKEVDLLKKDIINFQKIKLINAMIDFDRSPVIQINSQVFF